MKNISIILKLYIMSFEAILFISGCTADSQSGHSSVNSQDVSQRNSGELTADTTSPLQEEQSDPTEHFSVQDIVKNRLECYMITSSAASDGYFFYYPVKADLVEEDETIEGSIRVRDLEKGTDDVLCNLDEGEKVLLMSACNDTMAALTYVYSENTANTYWMRTCSTDGTSTKINITEDLSHETLFTNNELGLDKNGNIYFCCSDQQVKVWNSEGQLAGSYAVDHILTAMAAGDGEGVYLFSSGSGGVCIQKVTPSGVVSVAENLEIAELEGAAVSVMDGNCLLYNNMELYEVEISSGNIIQTTSASELYLSNFNEIFCTVNDGQWCINSYLANLSAPYTITSRVLKKEASAQKQILTLRGVYLTDSVLEKVAIFNGNHSDCKIEVIESDSYSMDYEALKKEFKQSIIDQESCDIYYFPAEIALYDLVGTGAFANMADFINNDEQLSMNDFCPGIISANTYHDILYTVPESFVLLSSLVCKSIWEETGDTTLDAVSSAMDANPGLYLDDDSTTPDALLVKLMMGGNRSVISDGSLMIDKDDIKSILKFSKKYGCVPEGSGDYFDNNEAMLYDYIEITEHNLESAWWSTENNEEYIICGFPSLDGSGTYFRTSYSWSISSQCSNPELAWEFVREFFTEEYQVENSSPYFSVNIHSLEKQVKALNADEYYVQEFYRCLNDAKYVLENDSQSYKIIEEEAAGFFSGEKSLDEVSQSAYERLQLYAAEQN